MAAISRSAQVETVIANARHSIEVPHEWNVPPVIDLAAGQAVECLDGSPHPGVHRSRQRRRHRARCRVTSLARRLAALVESAPPDAVVPVRWIGELLAAEGDGLAATTPAVDFTVDQLAAQFQRGPSTIRTWCGRGELPGAYRSHGREWRIPASAVASMQAAEAKRHAAAPRRAPRSRPRSTDITEWRNHLPAKQKAS